MYKNPFSFLYEHPSYPHARTLRTSATQKIRDSYSVLAGETGISSGIRWFYQASSIDDVIKQVRLGVFDWLTLCLPYGISWGLAKLVVAIQAQKTIHAEIAPPSQGVKRALSLIFRGVTHYVEYPIWLIFLLWNVLVHGLLRAVFGVLCVFFFGLIIGLPVAYLSQRYSRTIKQEAFSLEGKVSSVTDGAAIQLLVNRVYAKTPIMSASQSSEEALSLEHAVKTVNDNAQEGFNQLLDTTLEHFLLKEKAEHMNISFDEEHYQSMFMSTTLSEPEVHCLVIYHPSSRLKFYAEINTKNQGAIKQLIQLNFAHVADVCDDSSQTLYRQK